MRARDIYKDALASLRVMSRCSFNNGVLMGEGYYILVVRLQI